MTQKTNQFNSTTLRLNDKQLLNLITNKDYLVYQCKAKDNFGDYGIIGLAIIKIVKNLRQQKWKTLYLAVEPWVEKLKNTFTKKYLES